MKLINVAYDYEYDDNDVLIDMGPVDILCVPDYVHDHLEDIVKEFDYWVGDEVYEGEKSKHPEYWAQQENGEVVMNVGTEHFINWLNDHYYHCENKKSYMVEENTTYNPDYPTAEF